MSFITKRGKSFEAYFLSNPKFNLKDPELKISTFKWPPQKCVKCTDEELIAFGGATGVAVAPEKATSAAVEGWLGAVGRMVASGDVYKAEHYPRTVLFSFFKNVV